jgi:hypothetical protein
MVVAIGTGMTYPKRSIVLHLADKRAKRPVNSCGFHIAEVLNVCEYLQQLVGRVCLSKTPGFGIYCAVTVKLYRQRKLLISWCAELSGFLLRELFKFTKRAAPFFCG